jgi:hypothetical protein
MWEERGDGLYSFRMSALTQGRQRNLSQTGVHVEVEQGSKRPTMTMQIQFVIDGKHS